MHSHGWLILINSLIAMGIATRYFAFLPEIPTDVLGLSFLISGTFSQMVLLAGLIGLVALPAIFISNAKMRNATQAIIASLGIATLFIDTMVFAQYRFHINAVVLELVLSGQVVSFPLITWITVIGGVVALVAGQYLLISWLEKPAAVTQHKLGRKFAIITFFALLATHGIHIWAAANAYQPVTTVKRYLPVFLSCNINKHDEKIRMGK